MRVIRTIALTAVLALIIVPASQAKKPSLPSQIASTVVLTWTCQDQRSVPRSHARSPWRPHSRNFRAVELQKWKQRLRECRKALHAHDDMIRRLQRGLAGTPMDGTAAQLEAAGRKYGIHPAFIAAIAGTESSFGAAACSSNRYNAFGLSSCGAGWRVPNFRSWAEVYDFMGSFLSQRWPNARTTYDFHGYAACSQCWGAKNAYWMRAKFGLSNSVRYS